MPTVFRPTIFFTDKVIRNYSDKISQERLPKNRQSVTQDIRIYLLPVSSSLSCYLSVVLSPHLLLPRLDSSLFLLYKLVFLNEGSLPPINHRRHPSPLVASCVVAASWPKSLLFISFEQTKSNKARDTRGKIRKRGKSNTWAWEKIEFRKPSRWHNQNLALIFAEAGHSPSRLISTRTFKEIRGLQRVWFLRNFEGSKR